MRGRLVASPSTTVGVDGRPGREQPLTFKPLQPVAGLGIHHLMIKGTRSGVKTLLSIVRRSSLRTHMHDAVLVIRHHQPRQPLAVVIHRHARQVSSIPIGLRRLVGRDLRPTAAIIHHHHHPPGLADGEERGRRRQVTG
jgi:hypothetical protein